MQTCFAAFVPQSNTGKEITANEQTQSLIASLTVEEFEQLFGCKLSRLEKWQYKKMQRKMQGSSKAFIPERDELTEGFQALPFFGAIFTFGISALVMIFTAQDRNALRWAFYGVSLLGIALSVISLAGAMSGY